MVRRDPWYVPSQILHEYSLEIFLLLVGIGPTGLTQGTVCSVQPSLLHDSVSLESCFMVAALDQWARDDPDRGGQLIQPENDIS